MVDDDPQKPLIALGVAMLALSLIADEKFPLDLTRSAARQTLQLLADKYGYSTEEA